MNLVNGQAIVKLRQQKGWDQKTLAHEAGVDASVLSRLERNMQPDFKLSVLIAIAEALGVSLDSLLYSTKNVEVILEPELRIAFEQLSQLSPRLQRQAAAIMNGYLSSLAEMEKENSLDK